MSSLDRRDIRLGVAWSGLAGAGYPGSCGQKYTLYVRTGVAGINMPRYAIRCHISCVIFREFKHPPRCL